jgi:hypothetical protein
METDESYNNVGMGFRAKPLDGKWNDYIGKEMRWVTNGCPEIWGKLSGQDVPKGTLYFKDSVVFDLAGFAYISHEEFPLDTSYVIGPRNLPPKMTLKDMIEQNNYLKRSELKQRIASKKKGRIESLIERVKKITRSKDEVRDPVDNNLGDKAEYRL